MLAFWFVLRWLLIGTLILLLGRLLVLMMVVGAIGTLDQNLYAWAARFAGSALLCWLLLRRWRGFPLVVRYRPRVSALLASRGKARERASAAAALADTVETEDQEATAEQLRRQAV